MSIRDIHNLLKESLSSLLPVSYNVDPSIQPRSDKVIFAQSVLYDHCQIPEQWKNNKAGMY
jgi:hypothetical protein